MITRRSAFAAFAAALAAPLAITAAHAQTPAGSIPSTTAPSNSEGTPSGGTGVVSGTRVPGATTTAPPMQHTRRHHRRHHHHRTTTTTTTTPQ